LHVIEVQGQQTRTEYGLSMEIENVMAASDLHFRSTTLTIDAVVPA
jgi:hypothetical protein